jgi:hypothetical protein
MAVSAQYVDALIHKAIFEWVWSIKKISRIYNVGKSRVQRNDAMNCSDHRFPELRHRELVRTTISRVQQVEDLLESAFVVENLTAQDVKQRKGFVASSASWRCRSSSPASVSSVPARTARG